MDSLRSRDDCPDCTRRTVEDRRFPPFILDNPIRRFLSPPANMLKGHIAPGMVVADLGCGPGYLTLPAARMAGPDGRVYAVDHDPKSISALSRKLSERNLASVETHVSSAASMPFIPDAGVDVVIAKGLICCMSDHEGVVREVQRVMRPRGSAFFSITRLGSKDDARYVGREEWVSIVGRFRVQEKGDGLTNRWAWLTSRPVASG